MSQPTDEADPTDDMDLDEGEMVEQADDPVEDPDAADIEDNPPTADQSLRYFGADYDVDGLVRRLRNEDLQIPTFDPEGGADTGYEGFQRRFVWPKKQMDRFIESLLLGYPVPGIFLVEMKNRKYLVLDGQQRLRTLRAFYDGKYGWPGREKIFRLQFVGRQFAGRTFESLEPSDRRLLDNTFLQATIVVPSNDRDKSSVYRLFERINSSGIKLQPQEIRVALYSGKIIRFIRDLNSDLDWRAMFGASHSRLKDHELILRYLALSEVASGLAAHDWDRAEASSAGVRVYRPPMSTFLNLYLDDHINMANINQREVIDEFGEVTRLLNEAFGRTSLRMGGNQVNAAHTDAILVGLTLALRADPSLNAERCRIALNALLLNRDYMESVSGSTSHRDSVINRLQISVREFGSV